METDFEIPWDDLNETQMEAVTTTEGYVRVIAGAGSGKTRALSRRFAFLVNEVGILPGNILCVTFTNKSANEMRQRIHQLTGDRDTGMICTFHSFCDTVLHEESFAVHYPKNFLVLDNSDIDLMLQQIYEERDLTMRHMTFSKARDMIEMRKLFKNPEYYLDMIAMSLDELYQKYRNAVETTDIIFYGYLYQEKKCFALDYNDLIKYTLYIFEQNEDIRLKWQQRLEYIMIDEFQDIDELQYHLMSVLCGYHHNLFIVGDPDQTIYTWRGANVRYLLDFERNFPGTQTIMMMENYRSTPQILAAANSLIAKNRQRIRKDLLPILADGSRPVYYHAKNSAAEGEWMAKQIQGLLAQGIPANQIAVLYRAHFVTRTVEEAFLAAEIPYHIYSGVQFFDRAEIKDALAYLRMIAYKDDLSFLRIVNNPKRNIGRKRMKFLQEYAESHHVTMYRALTIHLHEELFAGTGAAEFVVLVEKFAETYQEKSISRVLSELLDESGYEKQLRTEGAQDRLDNLAELKQSIFEFETTCGEESTLDSYLSHVALFTNQDVAETGQKVKMMTVHTAKGLEFPYVFLCAMNEGIFPSRKTASQAAMEEERRLAFVAITRAKQGLYLSDAEGRNFDQSPRYPSRFVLDIEPERIDYVEPLPEELIAGTQSYIRLANRAMVPDTMDLPFGAGDRIVHKIMGPGKILEVDTEKGVYVILFDRMATKRSISTRVKLERE